MQPLDWALLPFARYFDFSGRSTRAEYWYFTAFMWFVSLLILMVTEGDRGPNLYGPNPYGLTYGY